MSTVSGEVPNMARMAAMARQGTHELGALEDI